MPDPIVVDPLEQLKALKAAPVVDPLEQLKATKPGPISRAGTIIANAVSQAVHHPIDTAISLIHEPLASFTDAVLAPGEGEARHDPRLSKGGNSSGRPLDLNTPYDAAHGAVTPTERAKATVATVSDAVFPGVTEAAGERLAHLGLNKVVSKLGGLAAAGAATGAANNLNDPVTGALAGAVLAPATERVGAAAGDLAGLASRGASRVVDVAGRPSESRPITIGGKTITTVPSLSDRAAELNARDLAQSPTANGLPASSTKPVTPMDVAGTAGVRLARGLKTMSPSAESVFQEGLRGRADAAVDRVIQHGLEATGLGTRENGLQVVDDMIAQRAQHGNENYRPVFAKYTAPIDDPEFAKIAATPAGKQALARAGVLAANRGDAIGSIVDGETQRVAPTLQQAHNVKLAFDDMLSSAPEPGTGGMGPNNANAIRALKNRWVAAMETAAPEYKTARTTFADESELVRAAELGRNLWKMHPAEAEKAMNELPTSARDVARRTGFDALAERVENGPSDVERGISKPRDERRMRLLFPDDKSFADFKQGLSEEARMHGNSEGVLGGSNTADKLSDMASMAGIGLPDLMQAAATGRLRRLAGRVAASAARKVMSTGADELSAERARLLMAGSNGNPSDRLSALARMRMVPDNTATGPITPREHFTRSMEDALAEHYRTQFLPVAAGISSGSPRR